MISKTDVMSGLQTALPAAKLMWHDEGKGEATVIITTREAEHYVGINLGEPDLSADELVRNIVKVVE